MSKNVIKEDAVGTYIEISSPRHGIKKCYIDKEDVGEVQEHRWCVIKYKRKKQEDVFYVRCKIKVNDKWKTKSLHRFLTKAEDGLQIDHIDGNPLDNRRSNLRAVTHQQNHFNRTSARGCYWNKLLKKYQAQITVDGKQIHLGCFDTEQEARAAYLEAKEKYHIIGK